MPAIRNNDSDMIEARPRKMTTVSAIPAKERILQAAILRFASHSYAETSLRDIAADASVDIAYLHRSFGSKADLFRKVLTAVMKLDELLSNPPDAETLLCRLCEQVLARDASIPEDVQAFNLVIRSCTCIDAREILRDFLETQIDSVLTRDGTLGDPLRIALATSLLSGVVIKRGILRMAAYRDVDEDALRKELRAVIRLILGRTDPAFPAETRID